MESSSLICDVSWRSQSRGRMFALDFAETLLKHKKHGLGKAGLENSPSDIIHVNFRAGG